MIYKNKIEKGLFGWVSKIKDRMYRTITPRGYHIGQAAKEFIKGDTRDMSKFTPLENEVWARYLGTKYEGPSNLEPAVYRPTKGGATYNDVVKLKDESLILSDNVLKLLLDNYKKTGKKSMLVKGNESGLGTYTISMGEDKNGKYISYYDDWDINPTRGISAKYNIPILSLIGDIVPGTHPFSVYGRRYYKNGGLIRKMLTAAGGPIRKPIKRLKDGYRYIPDGKNGGWDRISDNSMSDVFAATEVTPKKTKVGSSITRKQSAPSKTYYSAYNPDDIVKGFNALTLGGLNNLSPTLWVRRVYDTGKLLSRNMTWSGYTNSWINGNNGLVSLLFAEDHPYLSTGINLVGDISTIGLGTLAKKGILNVRKTTVDTLSDTVPEVSTLKPSALNLEQVKQAFNEAKKWHLNRINSVGHYGEFKDRALKAGFTKEEVPLLQQLLTSQINRLKLLKPEEVFGNNIIVKNNFKGENIAGYWKGLSNDGTLKQGIGFYDPNISYDDAVSTFIHELGHGATFGINGNETSGYMKAIADLFPLITRAVKYNKTLYPEVNELVVTEVFPNGAYNAKYFAEPTEMLSRGYEFMRDFNNSFDKLSSLGKSFTIHDVVDNAANTRFNSKLFKGLTGSLGAYNFAAKALGLSIPIGHNLYKNLQLQYLKQGGKMNAIEQFKEGHKIHIKKKNRGKFTAYCGGNVTSACIAKAKASGNPTLVKRATFAANARKWKHKEGGIIKAETGLSTNSFIDPMIIDYIKAIENPNRVGWNGKIWKAPGIKGYDLNLRGYGIDINTNNAARKLTAGRQGQWLTDAEANTLMRDHILYITNAANKHIKGFGELPIKRKAALLGILYRGDSVNKSNINITEPDDDKFFNSVHNYYISKGLKERANNSSKFFKSYNITPNFNNTIPNFNFNNYKDLNYPFKYIK